MELNKKNLGTAAALFAAAFIVAGCGGGGGGSDPAPSPAPAPAPASTIVTDVPAPTYAAGSNELLAFNTLNNERSRCGFGKLAQNAKLDQAASNHRAYLVANQSTGHAETAGLSGFTGADAQARANAVAYGGSVGEAVTTGIFSTPASFGSGDRQTLGLIGLPYHAFLATEGTLDIGLAWGGAAFVAVIGTPTGKAMQAASGVRTYPCDGSANVIFAGFSEVPSPFPSQPGTNWGPTITVVGTQIRVSSASVTGPSGSVAMKAIYGDGQAADPNGVCKTDRACIIPVPLEQGTVYQVTISGTQGGTPFTKAFSFTTIKLP